MWVNSTRIEVQEGVPWMYNLLTFAPLTRWDRHKMANTLADDIFKSNFVNESVLASIKISLNFVSKGPIE